MHLEFIERKSERKKKKGKKNNFIFEDTKMIHGKKENETSNECHKQYSGCTTLNLLQHKTRIAAAQRKEKHGSMETKKHKTALRPIEHIFKIKKKKKRVTTNRRKKKKLKINKKKTRDATNNQQQK
jgi:hypothetical protein